LKQILRRPSSYFTNSTSSSDAIFRAAAVAVRGAGKDCHYAEAAKDLGYAADEMVHAVLKTASTPTSLLNVGFSSMGAADIVTLAPGSAASQLMAAGLQVSLDGRAMLQLPSYLVSGANAGKWVLEGAPIPVVDAAFATGLQLEPRKLAVISVITRELSIHSDIMNILRAIVPRAIDLALDVAAFSTNADDGTTPGGVLAGVADSGASAASGQAALIEDVSTLTAALAALGGGTNIIFITDPAAAMRMRLWAPPRFTSPILASAAITTDTLVAVEASAFVSAFLPGAEISASTEALVTLENTTPLPIVNAGSTPAPNVRSLYQTDCVALRTIFRGNFGLIGGLVARVASVAW
jgi:hypothetical protein